MSQPVKLTRQSFHIEIFRGNAVAEKVFRSFTEAVRVLMTEAFDDEDFTIFCYDHFRPVHKKFSAGLTFPQKVHYLVDYCDRNNLFDELLPLVKDFNPGKYSEFSPYIVLPKRGTEPKVEVFPFLINVFALIALWFALLINNQFATIFSELFFWPPNRLETFSVSLLLLTITHLIWRFHGQQLVELVERANISIISRISIFLLEIVNLLHPQALNNRVLWASFWVAFILNLVLAWRLPPACPQAAGGRIAPDIALYSVTFIVNGIEQFVDNVNNSLRVPESDQMTVVVKEVMVCTTPFEGGGGTFYVEFRPYNAEGPLWNLVEGSPLSDAASRLVSVPGPAYTWAIDNDWQEISILSVHYPTNPGALLSTDTAYPGLLELAGTFPVMYDNRRFYFSDETTYSFKFYVPDGFIGFHYVYCCGAEGAWTVTD